MKNSKKGFFILIVAVQFFVSIGCKTQVKKSSDKLPNAVNDIALIKKEMQGKKWQVIDVAKIQGSAPSLFNKEHALAKTTIALPDVKNLSWLSEMKDLATSTDFKVKFLHESFEKYKKISFAFNNDSLATTTGLDAVKQLFVVTNTPEEKEPNGNKLKMIYEGEAFGNPMKMTVTYYVLGINATYLYLLTPNAIDREKLVFLLEAK